MKRKIRLSESDLRVMIKECARRLMNEGVYGYPDEADHIILLFEHDPECMKMYENIVRMLMKKAEKGVELSVDVLANSSIMKRFQQYCFRKFKDEQIDQSVFNENSPRVFRQHVAERMIEDVNDGAYAQVNEGVADFYKGIDDYPDAPSAEKQWKDYRELQGLDKDYDYLEWEKAHDGFSKRPKWYGDAEFGLDEPFTRFSRCKDGREGMNALNPERTDCRFNPLYNGFKSADPNNPSVGGYEAGDNSLPDEYLNEGSIKRIVRESIKKVLKEGADSEPVYRLDGMYMDDLDNSWKNYIDEDVMNVPYSEAMDDLQQLIDSTDFVMLLWVTNGETGERSETYASYTEEDAIKNGYPKADHYYQFRN